MGVIADGTHDIRVAFSAVDVGELEDLFAQMGAAAKDLLEEDGAGSNGNRHRLRRVATI